jgi:hypothetical protein
MRQGSNPKRPRGRNGRKSPNPRSQSFESSGPEVKVRGNAQQVVEKYLALARDASTAGDRIMSESYFQHAEHYYRLMTANGGPEGRDGQPRQDAVNPQEGHSQPVMDGAMAAPEQAPEQAGEQAPGQAVEQAAQAVPVTNGAEAPVADPASAPQPESDPKQAAQAE